MKALRARQLFDGIAFHQDRALLLEDGLILAVVGPGELPDGVPCEVLPADQFLAPGYVDLQVNGGGDVLFNDRIDAAGLGAIAAAHRALGTTSLFATLISPSRAQIAAALDLLAAPLAGIAGLHLEGPFLAPARRGIHPAASILTWQADDLALLSRPIAGRVLVTLAPECVPPGTARQLAKAGVRVFAGHSAARQDQLAAELPALTGATHLFNAMSQITPREPGLVGAILGDGAAMAGIILDGLHVHPANAALALRLIGPDRLFLVSDAMSTVGGQRGSLRLGETEITLNDGRLTGPDGTLGGAHLSMAEAVRNCVAFGGASLADALRMATATPARAAGLEDCGRLAPEMPAALIALDGGLRVRGVWEPSHALQTTDFANSTG
jgi:N-acetylglucosamine-6-phosphate deacetylase